MDTVGAAADRPSRSGPGRERRHGRAPDAARLTELLTETRILLPGTEVFLGFLATVPFTAHFADLDVSRRWVYVCTFFSTVLALVLFVVPAAYHRLARPIRHKERFKSFANRFLVAGLIPMSISIILTTYFVSYVVVDGAALYLSGAVALLIGAVWWVVPLVRMHDHVPSQKKSIAPTPTEHRRARAAARPMRPSMPGSSS